MLLREILERLEEEEEAALFDDVTFREKDALLLKQECRLKYDAYLRLAAHKLALDDRLLQLKEDLCRISPEALEEIQRDCSQKNDSEDNPHYRSKKARPKAPSKNIKKNERRKKNQQKLTYN